MPSERMLSSIISWTVAVGSIVLLESAVASAEEKQPGESFRDQLVDGQPCPLCPELVVIPAGSFKMGSTPTEIAALKKRVASYIYLSEGPQHKVTIARPFAVSKYEVTFAEWDACAAGGGCGSNSRPDDKGWGRGRRPVINVSWEDAKEYLAWLSRKTGKSYRLLTEAEWEYAARAGTTTQYAFGDTVTKSQAQFSEGQWGSAGKTVEVGSFQANRFGLNDMHGNVFEWCEDDWHPTYQGAPMDGSAWEGDDMPPRKVMRGGSWNYDSGLLRSASRGPYPADARIYFLGFRVARTLRP